MQALNLNKLQVITLTAASSTLVYKSFWDDVTLSQVAAIVAATIFLVVVLGQFAFRITKRWFGILTAACGVIVGILIVMATKQKRHEEVPSPALEQAAPYPAPPVSGIPLEEFLKRQQQQR